MTRRSFFGMLAAGLAAAVDPERLLWVPGRKLISIPKSRSQFVDPRVISVEFLRLFKINMERAAAINREFDREFAGQWSSTDALQVGDTFTVDIRTGPAYEVVRRPYRIVSVAESTADISMEVRPLRRRSRR